MYIIRGAIRTSYNMHLIRNTHIIFIFITHYIQF
nr:MAG TPA: hypothetical protein [Caudoviricetes sp.]